MELVVEMFEVMLLVSIYINIRLWLVNVDTGWLSVVREVFVESHPWSLSGSAWRGGGGGGGGRSWCGGSSGSGGGGWWHPEGR